MSRSIRRSLVTLFLVLATMAQAMVADAGSRRNESVGRLPVRYHDLDLQKEADAQTLLQRIEHAAGLACGGNPKFQPTYDLMPRFTVQVFEDCRQNGVTRAVIAVNAPKLWQAYTMVYGSKPQCAAPTSSG